MFPYTELPCGRSGRDILPPDSVVAYTKPQFGLTAAWTDFRNLRAPQSAYGVTCRYPEMWERLCGVLFASPGSDARECQWVWNGGNLVVRHLDGRCWHDLPPVGATWEEVTDTFCRICGSSPSQGEVAVIVLRLLIEAGQNPHRSDFSLPAPVSLDGLPWLPAYLWVEEPAKSNRLTLRKGQGGGMLMGLAKSTPSRLIELRHDGIRSFDRSGLDIAGTIRSGAGVAAGMVRPQSYRYQLLTPANAGLSFFAHVTDASGGYGLIHFCSLRDPGSGSPKSRFVLPRAVGTLPRKTGAPARESRR